MEKDSVKYMSNLARLALTPEEEKSLQKDVFAILDYVDKLKNLKIVNKETKELINNKNVLREDIEKDFNDKDVLIKNFNEKEERLLKVRSIF